MSTTIAGSSIYIGFWVDWSRNLIIGSTITLSGRSASTLTAFLALFVTIVGSCLWRIFSFISHQGSASPDAKDGIHHQHQLVFRNGGSPFEATKSFFDIAWAWRRNGRRPWSRSLPLAFFALAYLLAFGAASILTSLITRAAGTQRLIVSDNCGFFAFDQKAGLADRTLAMQYKDLNDTFVAAEYARQCYSRETVLNNQLRCEMYATQSIGWEAQDTDCLFDSSICSASRAYKLDTGVIDSHTDLGVNIPAAGRVGFRKVTTCSPLSVQAPYVSVIASSSLDNLGIEGDKIREYHYGTYLGASLDLNTTYRYNQHAYIDGFGYELR
jgi:hypothetical protein